MYQSIILINELLLVALGYMFLWEKMGIFAVAFFILQMGFIVAESVRQYREEKNADR